MQQRRLVGVEVKLDDPDSHSALGCLGHRSSIYFITLHGQEQPGCKWMMAWSSGREQVFNKVDWLNWAAEDATGRSYAGTSFNVVLFLRRL